MSDVIEQTPTIRKYQPDDATCLHQIDQICFERDVAFSRGELLFYLNHPGAVTLVAVSNERIIGFALGRVHQNRVAHVLTLDVLPEARRQRIGTLLMKSLHEEFRNRAISRVMLEVSTKNLPAQRLYGELQYTVLETLHGYYNGREDAFLMSLSL
ncbi:MAG TPA: GNAT family N-acetyltransferase [Acidobacteriota bacterium]|nr:GNAT family N-acetyltransferase [Acidobacteriota bacterium]